MLNRPTSRRELEEEEEERTLIIHHANRISVRQSKILQLYVLGCFITNLLGVTWESEKGGGGWPEGKEGRVFNRSVKTVMLTDSCFDLSS